VSPEELVPLVTAKQTLAKPPQFVLLKGAPTHRLDRLEEQTKKAFKDVLDELKLIQTTN